MKECVLVVNLEGQWLQKPLFAILLVLTWGLRYFLKRGNIRKRNHWNRGLKQRFTLCVGVSRKFHAQPLCFFNYFLVIKAILKALFSFIPWLFNSSDLLNSSEFLWMAQIRGKKYKLRLLSMCLGSTTKFLMSFFIQNASFSSKFRSLFSVIRHNHSVLFMKLYMLLTKGAHQSANF